MTSPQFPTNVNPLEYLMRPQEISNCHLRRDEHGDRYRANVCACHSLPDFKSCHLGYVAAVQNTTQDTIDKNPNAAVKWCISDDHVPKDLPTRDDQLSWKIGCINGIRAIHNFYKFIPDQGSDDQRNK